MIPHVLITAGIVTESVYEEDKSFIAASYVKFIESAGARVVPILYPWQLRGGGGGGGENATQMTTWSHKNGFRNTLCHSSCCLASRCTTSSVSDACHDAFQNLSSCPPL